MGWTRYMLARVMDLLAELTLKASVWFNERYFDLVRRPVLSKVRKKGAVPEAELYCEEDFFSAEGAEWWDDDEVTEVDIRRVFTERAEIPTVDARAAFRLDPTKAN